MRSPTSNCSIAASVSPPPAIENALLAAMASATRRVPAANSGFSNTPSGPFQTIVPALFEPLGVQRRGLGTDVEDHLVGSRRRAPS